MLRTMGLVAFETAYAAGKHVGMIGSSDAKDSLNRVREIAVSCRDARGLVEPCGQIHEMALFGVRNWLFSPRLHPNRLAQHRSSLDSATRGPCSQVTSVPGSIYLSFHRHR